MSGTVPMITPGSISGMTGLKDRPVYFLRLNNSPTPNLVVKGEKSFAAMEQDAPGIVKQANISIKWGSKLMKNVQHRMVNTKLMVAQEISIFQGTVRSAFMPGSPQFDNAINATYNWVKIPFVPGLSDAAFREEGLGGKADKKVTPLVIGKLADERIWHDLGIVLAVDIFVGNNDRFDIVSGFWVNHGNVMFLDDPNSAVIGLDTFDPNSAYGVGNLVTGGTHKALDTLKDPVKRLDFATKCARSVGENLATVFTDNNITRIPICVKNDHGDDSYCFVTKEEVESLYLDYAPAMAQGIEIGATRLKQYLDNKITRLKGPARPSTPAPQLPQKHKHFHMPSLNPFGAKKHQAAAPSFQRVSYGLPPAIEERMRYLGWVM